MVPAHFAVRYGTDSEVTRQTVGALIQEMKNPFKKDEFGNTILHHSILNVKEEVRTSVFSYLVTCNISRGMIRKDIFNFQKLVDIPNYERNYGLHIACERNHHDVIRTLMKNGHSIEVFNKQMMNALHVAADRKHPKCVGAIIENYPNSATEDYVKVLMKKDLNNNTPFMISIMKQEVEAVKILLSFQKEKLSFGNNEVNDLMNFCSTHGTKEISKVLYNVLLKGNTYQNPTNQQILNTSLHHAIESDESEIVSFMIEKNADVNAKHKGLLPIELAIKKGHTQVLQIIQSKQSQRRKKGEEEKVREEANLIHFAVRSEKAQMIWNVIEMLEKEGESSTKKRMLRGKEKKLKNTPLHEACTKQFSKAELGKFLQAYTEEGIQLVDLENDKKQTPLHLAAREGNLQYVEALVGVDFESLLEQIKDQSERKEKKEYVLELIDSPDVDGNKALHTAAEHDNYIVFEFLLKLSDDYKPANSYGKTPLHIIAEFGAEKCLPVLERHVASVNQLKRKKDKVMNVNKKDLQGNTPLHLAASKGHSLLVKELLKLRGNIAILDQKGKNALQIAIENRQESIVKAIVESDSWENSLRNGFREERDLNSVLDTPMRQLIKYFPQIAETVLDKCRKEIIDESDQKKTISYNFEFLEDTFKYKLMEENKEKVFKHVSERPDDEKDENGDFTQPYTYSGKTKPLEWFTAGNVFVDNHPLMTINDYKQQNLLMHEVTRKLINNKWNSFGLVCYYTNFLFYCGFLTALTVYIATSIDISPQMYPNLYTCSPFFNESNFAHVNQSYVFPEDALNRKGYTYTSRAFIWVFAAFRLAALLVGYEKKFLFGFFWKIAQIVVGPILFLKEWCSSTSKWKFLKKKWEQLKTFMKNNNLFYFILKQEWAFIFDINVYIFAVIIDYYGYYNPVMMDGKKLHLYLKPCWAWQMSAATITLAWINLLVYMRQMPLFGNYIIILNDIIYTFIQFVVIFVIFIISFTFGFQVLVYTEGTTFGSFKDAFLKTMIMMAGEFDYGSLFYPDGEIYPEDASSAYYPGLLYAFFILFFVLLSLLLLNLLVGLSVSDVNIFVEVADLKKMSMRLKFVLNMERFLNSWIVNFFRKKLPAVFAKLKPKKVRNKVKKKDLYVDDHKSKMWKQVIATNVQEDKQRDMEEIKIKAKTIEDKLIEMEKDAKKDHKKRKEELENTIENFRMSLEEKGKEEFQKNMEALKESLDKELEGRNSEVDRTINFMTNLSTKIDSVSQRNTDHDQFNERQRTKKDRIERIEDKVNDMRKQMTDFIQRNSNNDEFNERQRSKKDRIERIEDKVNEMRYDMDYIKNILHQILENKIQRESTQQSLGHDPQSIII